MVPDDVDQVAAVDRFLSDREARCVKCRYELRGVRGGRCPECGWVIVLGRLDWVSVVRPEPAWFTALVVFDVLGAIGMLGGGMCLAPAGVFGGKGTGGAWSFIVPIVVALAGVWAIVAITLATGEDRTGRRVMWLALGSPVFTFGVLWAASLIGALVI